MKDYYGEYPDFDGHEPVKSKREGWIIILVNVLFFGSLIMAAYCSVR
jgi:hypothetical protein